MEYSEALDIVARSRTQFQAFEQLDEVLKKPPVWIIMSRNSRGGAMICRKRSRYNQEKLDEIKQSVNATAADYEARLSQLKKAIGRCHPGEGQGRS